jgi:hypothetical protein
VYALVSPPRVSGIKEEDGERVVNQSRSADVGNHCFRGGPNGESVYAHEAQIAGAMTLVNLAEATGGTAVENSNDYLVAVAASRGPSGVSLCVGIRTTGSGREMPGCKAKGRRVTPAMQAGITDRVWDIAELLT